MKITNNNPIDLDTLPESAQRIGRALIRCDGVQSRAAKKLGMTRQGISNAVRRYPELKELRDQLIESAVDAAEGLVMREIRKGNLAAAKMLLLYHPKGRARGWSNHHDVSIDDSKIQIVYVPQKAQTDDDWEKHAQAADAASRRRVLTNGAADA